MRDAVESAGLIEGLGKRKPKPMNCDHGRRESRCKDFASPGFVRSCGHPKLFEDQASSSHTQIKLLRGGSVLRCRTSARRT
jgi:hypothetical protein